MQSVNQKNSEEAIIAGLHFRPKNILQISLSTLELFILGN